MIRNNTEEVEPLPRNVLLIALTILELIPEDKTNFYRAVDYLIKHDFSYKDNLSLTDSYNWQKLENIMHRYIPVADEEWKIKIVNFYIGNITKV